MPSNIHDLHLRCAAFCIARYAAFCIARYAAFCIARYAAFLPLSSSLASYPLISCYFLQDPPLATLLAQIFCPDLVASFEVSNASGKRTRVYMVLEHKSRPDKGVGITDYRRRATVAGENPKPGSFRSDLYRQRRLADAELLAIRSR